MKALKISLVVVVVAAIGSGIFFWIDFINNPTPPPESQNQFILKIKKEIEQLKGKPDSKFCKDFYNEVASHINEFYKPMPPQYPYGRLGKNQLENDQRKENLELNLYSAYAEKFIKQAHIVFRGSQWNRGDLKFIRAETKELRKSNLLLSESPVDKEFMSIQTVLNKYYEIISFVSTCKSFSYYGTALSDTFPISEVQSKISHAAVLLSTRLENENVNNCIRLHNELKEIPQTMFKIHISYLDNKINNWSEVYSNYSSHNDYSSNLYQPLNEEIVDLDNDIYNVPNFDSEYDRLLQKWSADNIKAYMFNYEND